MSLTARADTRKHATQRMSSTQNGLVSKTSEGFGPISSSLLQSQINSIRSSVSKPFRMSLESQAPKYGEKKHTIFKFLTDYCKEAI